jgi:hypothetical protein
MSNTMTNERRQIGSTVVAVTATLLAMAQLYAAPKLPYLAMAKAESALLLPAHASLDDASAVMQHRLGYSCSLGHGEFSLVADRLDKGKNPASVSAPTYLRCRRNHAWIFPLSGEGTIIYFVPSPDQTLRQYILVSFVFA